MAFVKIENLDNNDDVTDGSQTVEDGTGDDDKDYDYGEIMMTLAVNIEEMAIMVLIMVMGRNMVMVKFLLKPVSPPGPNF